MMATRVEDLDDGRLIEAHMGRDEEAFSVLYRRFYPRLVRLLRRRTGDQEFAEDLAQDTLVKALHHLESFDTNRPLWPWLKTIATNLAIDHARGSARESLQEIPEDRNGCELGWSEDSPILMEALARLPQRQRIALSLRYLDDWRSGEAAIFLGLSRTSFEQLLHRGRRKLREAYRELGGEALGTIALPFKFLKQASLKASVQSQRVHDWLVTMGPASAAAASQLVSAVIAAALVATPAIAPVASRSLEEPRQAVTHSFSKNGNAGNGGERSATSGATGAGTIDGSSHEPEAGGQSDGGAADELVHEVTRPNEHVKQPEDAHITGLTYSPNYERDHTVFAAGVATCKLPNCRPVLFVSRDGGHSWKKLWAKRFEGNSVLLPPEFGLSDTRIFAMGPSGLQVSENDGSTFRPAALGGAGYAVGTVAISPAFNQGDPTILIGAQSLMRYDDVRQSVEPTAYTSLPGPLEPAYSPAYPADDRILVGGVRVDPLSGSVRSTVFVCNGSLCRESELGDNPQVPKVRMAPDFHNSEAVYAFTENELFASVNVNGGLEFSEVTTPWKAGLRDVAVGEGAKTLFAATTPALTGRGRGTQSQGLYASYDSGRSWIKIQNELFSHGAVSVTMMNDVIFAAPSRGGVACSSDLGRTWRKRCR